MIQNQFLLTSNVSIFSLQTLDQTRSAVTY